MALQAKIKKKFSGFTLDVEFETKEGCMGILGALFYRLTPNY